MLRLRAVFFRARKIPFAQIIKGFAPSIKVCVVKAYSKRESNLQKSGRLLFLRSFSPFRLGGAERRDASLTRRSICFAYLVTDEIYKTRYSAKALDMRCQNGNASEVTLCVGRAAGRIATIVAGGNIYSTSAQGIRLGASHSARLQNEPPWSNLHSLACASTDSLRLIILLASSPPLWWLSVTPHLPDYFPPINCSRFISWLYFAEPRLSFSRIADVRSIPSTAAMAIT